LDNTLKAKIAFEILQIDELIEELSPLLEKCIAREPDFIELNAAGAVLHAYYNGLESIFLLIGKNVDGTRISGERWHTELLNSMFKPTKKRKALFDEELYDQLTDYMGFRHFFRHTYSYHLRWDLIKPLLMNIRENWISVKAAVQRFIDL